MKFTKDEVYIIRRALGLNRRHPAIRNSVLLKSVFLPRRQPLTPEWVDAEAAKLPEAARNLARIGYLQLKVDGARGIIEKSRRIDFIASITKDGISGYRRFVEAGSITSSLIPSAPLGLPPMEEARE